MTPKKYKKNDSNKRRLSFALVALTALGMLPASAFATPTCPNKKWAGTNWVNAKNREPDGAAYANLQQYNTMSGYYAGYECVTVTNYQCENQVWTVSGTWVIENTVTGAVESSGTYTQNGNAPTANSHPCPETY